MIFIPHLCFILLKLIKVLQIHNVVLVDIRNPNLRFRLNVIIFRINV